MLILIPAIFCLYIGLIMKKVIEDGRNRLIWGVISFLGIAFSPILYMFFIRPDISEIYNKGFFYNFIHIMLPLFMVIIGYSIVSAIYEKTKKN